jgi:hypothetical protein
VATELRGDIVGVADCPLRERRLYVPDAAGSRFLVLSVTTRRRLVHKRGDSVVTAAVARSMSAHTCIGSPTMHALPLANRRKRSRVCLAARVKGCDSVVC